MLHEHTDISKSLGDNRQHPIRMTAAIRPKDMTSQSVFGVDHFGPMSRQISSIDTFDTRDQLDIDPASLEGDISRRPSSGYGPALPPLHPQLPSPQAPSAAAPPPLFSRRSRTLSSDTIGSAGSSVVSIDAGKHGFITHDDASATGSLVLGYEQGREIPPAEYDLPHAILGIDAENRSVGYSVESEEEFQKLPYHIRKSRLNLSKLAVGNEPQQETRRWSNIPDLNLNSGYGGIEEGLIDIRDRVKTNNYYSPGNTSTAVNSMCWSTESTPLCDNRDMYPPQHHYYSVPEQLQMPMQSAWMPEEYSSSTNKREERSNNQTNVYLSMALVLVLFVGMIYGLFFIMKMVA